MARSLIGIFALVSILQIGWCYEVCRETATHIYYCDGSAPYCCQSDTACCTTAIPVWSIVLICVGGVFVIATIISIVAKMNNKPKQIVTPDQQVVMSTVPSQYPAQYPGQYPPQYPPVKPPQ